MYADLGGAGGRYRVMVNYWNLKKIGLPIQDCLVNSLLQRNAGLLI
jgi:hypothetical protein